MQRARLARRRPGAHTSGRRAAPAGTGGRPHMSSPYTVKRLTDVDDSAPRFGFGDVQEARFAHHDREAKPRGVSHLRLKARQRQPFAHKHEQAEEIYVILSGSGRLKL